MDRKLVSLFMFLICLLSLATHCCIATVPCLELNVCEGFIDLLWRINAHMHSDYGTSLIMIINNENIHLCYIFVCVETSPFIK